MDVSIILVNYNTFELTCKCIESIYSKTNGCSFEVIVVDNASTERDPCDFVERFPEVKLVKNQVNTGFAKGNNLGLQVATGDFALLLNSDAELINNAILACFQTIRRDSTLAVVGCRLEFPDGKTQHNCQRFPSFRYKLFEFLRVQKFLPPRMAGQLLLGSFFDHKTPVFPDWIWGTFFMFRRDLLGLLPGKRLAEDFFMYVEDMQWCKEFRRHGYRIAFIPEARAVHHMGKSNGVKAHFMEAHTKLFMEKYYSLWERSLIKNLDRWLFSKKK